MSSQNPFIIEDLGNGLVMRRSIPADAERLGTFNAEIHGENPQDARGVAAWTRDLLERPHPSFHTDDFVVVEDQSSGQIISSLNTIDQVWAYEGIPFGVGRPELVGTLAAYRNRGLVRKQFNFVHHLSQERGQLVQVITGIPFFYRQFGYEMGLELSGGRFGTELQVPKLKEGAPGVPGEEEAYQIRPAEAKDIPWLMKMYERDSRRSLVSSVMNEAHWRYELEGKSPDNVNRYEPCVIENRDGTPVGYLVHPSMMWGTMMSVIRYELDDGVSYAAVTPCVIRFLWELGQKKAVIFERKLETFGFWFGSNHPAYTVMGDRLRVRPPYAFYVRVPDLPVFIKHIAPALEKRLSESVCAGHSGEIKISFYRTGIKLVFEKGCLISAEDWKPVIHDDEGSCAFPNLTFLMLVFGYRSLEEIRHMFVDCWADADAGLLLGALFPKKASSVWPVS